ncbi:hypothetical protein BASA61_001564 [Batrachochytrium salamandrivorans]|nr:hypothetical protein BASA61_001564 [Batrachochytrium salamandrivorans]
MSTLQNGPKTELDTASLKAPQSSIVLLKAIKLLPTRTMLFVAVSDGSWFLFSVHVSGTLHLASTFFISGNVIDLEHRKAIVSVAFNDRVVCTFSEDYKISLFSYRPRQETVHIATLSGSKAGSPVDLHLTVTKGASFSWSGSPMFSLSVVCGSLVFGGGWEPYIQQVHFTDSRVVSSYQFFPSDLASHKPESRSFPSIYSTLKSSTPSCRSCNLAEDSTQPPSVRAYSMYWNPRLLSMEPIVHSFASISAISLAPPFVVCAHMDNSVQIYTFDYLYAKKLCECPTPETSLQQPKLVHVKTLYGHTSHVTAISLVQGRLITCANDGIKVWEIPDLHRQSMVFTSPNSSSLPPTPNIPGLSLSTILSSLPDDPVVTLMDLVSQRDFVDSSDSNYTTAAWVGVDSTRLVIHELRSTTTPMQRTLDDTDELCTPYPASSSKHALCQQQHILKVLNFS